MRGRGGGGGVRGGFRFNCSNNKSNSRTCNSIITGSSRTNRTQSCSVQSFVSLVGCFIYIPTSDVALGVVVVAMVDAAGVVVVTSILVVEAVVVATTSCCGGDGGNGYCGGNDDG